MKGLVALPQRLPIGALIRADGPDLDIGCSHAGDSGSLLTLFSRCGMNPQQLRYSIRRLAPEPAFRRDREVFHIFLCRCQAPARADQSVGVMHEAETQLGLGAKFEPIERRAVPIVR